MRYAPLLTSPGHLWASRISTWAPSHWKQRPPPRPAHHLWHTCKIPPSIEPSMSLSLTLGPFFSLEAEPVQGLQAYGVQTNTQQNWAYHLWMDFSFSFFISVSLLVLSFQHFCLTWARNWHMKVNRVWFLLSRSSLSSRRKQLWRQICAKYWNRCCNRRI